MNGNQILDSIQDHINRRKYKNDGKGLRFDQYITTQLDTDRILNEAREDVNAPTTALDVKALIQLWMDASDWADSIVVIDTVTEEEYVAQLRKMAFKVLKATIEDGDVTRLLPFQTSLELGETYVHIVNESAYALETKYHVIEQGDTLCARGGRPRGTVTGSSATCPGCLAKGKGAIVDFLLERSGDDYKLVAETLENV